MRVCLTIPWLIETLRKKQWRWIPASSWFSALLAVLWEGQAVLNDWACAHATSFLHSELPVRSSN